MYRCECTVCGYQMDSEDHYSILRCPQCDGQMRGAERPGVYKLSAFAVGADNNNKISAVRFKVGNAVVTQAAEGEGYEIYVDCRITIDYIRSKTEDPPFWQGGWKFIVAALCPSAGIYALGDYTTLQIGWPTEVVKNDFRLGDYFSGSNPRKMGKADQLFYICLVGCASTTVPNPTPSEILLMPVR